ncbi:MAG: aldehyde dehydrogenase family protein, partial [Chloroflexi bacterium]|nr:aldehyde dehydrogenase family protein [Chloroflexota bacterium]
MTETLIPDKAESTAELGRLRLRTQLFIDGGFRDAIGGDRFVTENPATGQPIAEVAKGGPADVDAAVAVARRAADDGRWSR